MTKIVSQLDADGYLIGTTLADPSPLEPGVFLIPGGCVEIEPPRVQSGQRAKFVDGAFVFEAIPSPPPPPEPAPPTQEELIRLFTAIIQQRLDSFAQTRNYDNILSACTYATSGVAKFKAEGQACVNLRDATWATAYQILAEVKTGKRPMPTSIVDIEADLPAVLWPK